MSTFRNRGLRRTATLATCAAAALLVAACGGDDGGSDDSGGGGTTAKAVPTLAAAKKAKGPLTVCTGKDTAGDRKDLVDDFNKRYGGQGLKAKLLEFPESADEQRNQFVQRQQARSSECDVFYADTVWMAEFAAQGWLLDMSAYVKERAPEFIASTLATNKVGDKYFGLPYDTDAALIFYRTDKVRQAPATWQDLYAQARQGDGLVYQGASYEGLTCDYLELAFAAGGTVLSADGKKSTIDSPQNRAALQLMVDGVKNGTALRGVTTYKEEEARRAFEAGRATFMRNWPYAYTLGKKAPKVRNSFAVAPLPQFAGAGRAGILGGKNYVISSFSKNPEGSLLFVDFGSSAEKNAHHAIEFGRAPVVSAAYDDAGVRKALPFSAELEQAVAQAKVRPVSPVYPQISAAIYKNVNAALSGQVSSEQALKQAHSQIEKALGTF